jgi:hypothetical protein
MKLIRVSPIIQFMQRLSLTLLTGAAITACSGKHTFTGTITDSVCNKADHSRMQMGPTDGECAIACIDEHGASWVLYDGKDSYVLSDQQTPEKFAGQKVRVVGTLDTKAKKIRMESISAMK